MNIKYFIICLFLANCSSPVKDKGISEPVEKQKSTIDSNYYYAKDIKSALEHKKDVRWLSLMDYEYDTLPKEVLNMKIEKFTFDNCEKLNFDDFFNDFYKREEVNYLKINNSFKGHMPASVSKFKYLKELKCFEEPLKSVPSSIGELENLTTIWLGYDLKRLPNEFEKLQNLTYLSLRGNSFSVFPPSILKLKKLEVLNLENNKIESIPEEIFELKNLKVLLLGGNPFAEKEWENYQKTSKSKFIETIKKKLPNCRVELLPLPVGS